MEDQLIVELFLERSEQAIAELDHKYGNLCRGLSRRILRITFRRSARIPCHPIYAGLREICL